MSSRNENLAKNTILFAIGNLGSKLLQIILVPFYTRVMTNAEFGTADVLQAIVTLLMPVFSLTIYEGVFRYAMEKGYDRRAVFSSGVLISAIGAAVLCVLGGIYSILSPMEYVWFVVANAVAGFFRSLLSQYVRAIDKTKLFTLDNILFTGYVLAFNILFIAVFNWSVSGYMLGYTLANVVSCLFLYIFMGSARKIGFRSVNRPLVKELLLFSIPLIPNTICWWVSSFIDRIIITTVEGEAANGIYAAAHKIPSLLTMIVTIFFQAWQISANQEFKKKDISDFYTEIHDQIFAVIMLISSGLILLCRPITGIFLGADYYAAWQIMPLMLVGMTFFSFAQFLGSIYSANKKTVMAFVTNFIAVLVSLSVNLLLVGYFKIGIIGSAIATCCSYFVLWTIRIISTGKIVPIKYQGKKVIFASVLLLGQAILITLSPDKLITYSIASAVVVVLAVLFWKNYMALLRFALGLAKKILKRG